MAFSDDILDISFDEESSPFSSDEIIDISFNEPENASLFDRVGSRVALTVPEIGKALGTNLDLILNGDETDFDFARNVFGALGPLGGPTVDALRTGAEYLGVDQAGDDLRSYSSDVSRRTREQYPNDNPYLELIPNLTSTIATGLANPALVPAQIASQQFGSLYSDLRDEGVDRATATNASAPAAALAGASSLLLPNVFKGGTGFVKGFAAPTALDTASEPLETAAELAGRSYATGESYTPEQVTEAMIDTLKVAGPMNLLTAGLGKVGSKAQDAYNIHRRNKIQIEEDHLFKQAEQMAVADEILGESTSKEVIRTLPKVVDLESVKSLEVKADEVQAKTFAEKQMISESVVTEPSQVKLPSESESAPQPISKIVDSRAEARRVEEQLTEQRLAREALQEPEPYFGPYEENTDVIPDTPNFEDYYDGEFNAPDVPDAMRTGGAGEHVIEDYQARLVPTSEVVTRPKLMQFKDITEGQEATGTNINDTIEGQWDPYKAGIITVWEPKNPSEYGLKDTERYIVANGHHRLKTAKEQSVDNLQINVLRESNGFSAADAKALAAEINIADGKGTVYDHAKFTRQQVKNNGRDGARARAKDIGILRRQGTAIALEAEAEVYTSFINQQITPAQAEAIVKTAPNDPAAQLAGLDLATKNKSASASDVSARVRATSAVANYETNHDASTQGDLFGGDTTIKDARAKVERTENTAKEWQNYYKHQAAALESAIKYPEEHGKVFEKRGITSEQLKAKYEEAKINQNRWKEYDIHSDLTTQAANGDLPPSFNAAKERAVSDAGDQVEASFLDLFSNEKGAIMLGKRLAEEPSGKITQTGQTPDQKFFEGDTSFTIGGKDVKLLPKGMQSAFRKGMIFPSTVAKKFIQFARSYQTGRTIEKDVAIMQNRFAQELTPYLEKSAASKRRVDSVLVTARKMGRRFKLNQENLSQFEFKDGSRLTNDEIQAIMSVRTSMDSALDVIEESLKEQYRNKFRLRALKGVDRKTNLDTLRKDFENVGKFIFEIKDQNYIPASRYGKHAIAVEDKAGEITEFYRFEDKKKAKRFAKQLEADGKNGRMYQISETKRDILGTSLPDYMRHRLAELDPDTFQGLGVDLTDENGQTVRPKGFARHFMRAGLVDGFETDLARPIADYVASLSHFSAKLRHEGTFDIEIEKLSKNDRHAALREYIQQYRQDMFSPDTAATWRQFLAAYNLGFNVKSAFVNATQSYTTTLPLLGKYASNSLISLKPEAIYMKAIKDTTAYLSGSKNWKNKHVDLNRALNRADQEGITSDLQAREMIGRERGTSRAKQALDSYTDASMVLFSAIERTNRVHAFAAGWEAAPGKTFQEKYDFASKFVDESQFVYSKANRPQAARTGIGSAAFTFRMFQGSWFRLIRDNFSDPRVMARMIANMGTLAGVAGFPFLKQIMDGAKIAGYDVESELREMAGEGNQGLIDATLYGPASLSGINISGALSLTEISDLEKGPVAIAGNTLLGVNAGMVNRIGRAKSYFDENPGSLAQRSYLATEQVLPEGLRNASVAARAALDSKGAFRDKKNREIYKPSTGQLVAKGLGFTPTQTSRTYAKRNAGYVLEDNRERDKNNINARLGDALRTGDSERFHAIMQENAETNARRRIQGLPPIRPNKAAIKRFMISQVDYDAARLSRAPKDIRADLIKQKKIYDDE